MLKNLGVRVYPEDKINVFPDPGLGLGSVINIQRATEVLVLDGDIETTYRTWKDKVGDVLKENNISIGSEDIVSPDIKSEVSRNLSIEITRVSENNETESISIPYDIVTNQDNTLERGKQKVVQEGINGIREKIYHIRKENGIEVARDLVSDKVVQKPVDKIVQIGTKITSYGTGVASYYIYSDAMIAACNIVPRGSKVRVVNLANGKSVVVMITGGGLRSDRIVDLSTGAFQALGGSLGTGLLFNVRLEKVE